MMFRCIALTMVFLKVFLPLSSLSFTLQFLLLPVVHVNGMWTQFTECCPPLRQAVNGINYAFNGSAGGTSGTGLFGNTWTGSSVSSIFSSPYWTTSGGQSGMVGGQSDCEKNSYHERGSARYTKATDDTSGVITYEKRSDSGSDPTSHGKPEQASTGGAFRGYLSAAATNAGSNAGGALHGVGIVGIADANATRGAGIGGIHTRGTPTPFESPLNSARGDGVTGGRGVTGRDNFPCLPRSPSQGLGLTGPPFHIGDLRTAGVANITKSGQLLTESGRLLQFHNLREMETVSPDGQMLRRNGSMYSPDPGTGFSLPRDDDVHSSKSSWHSVRSENTNDTNVDGLDTLYNDGVGHDRVYHRSIGLSDAARVRGSSEGAHDNGYDSDAEMSVSGDTISDFFMQNHEEGWKNQPELNDSKDVVPSSMDPSKLDYNDEEVNSEMDLVQLPPAGLSDGMLVSGHIYSPGPNSFDQDEDEIHIGSVNVGNGVGDNRSGDEYTQAQVDNGIAQPDRMRDLAFNGVKNGLLHLTSFKDFKGMDRGLLHTWGDEYDSRLSPVEAEHQMTEFAPVTGATGLRPGHLTGAEFDRRLAGESSEAVAANAVVGATRAVVGNAFRIPTHLLRNAHAMPNLRSLRATRLFSKKGKASPKDGDAQGRQLQKFEGLDGQKYYLNEQYLESLNRLSAEADQGNEDEDDIAVQQPGYLRLLDRIRKTTPQPWTYPVRLLGRWRTPDSSDTDSDVSEHRGNHRRGTARGVSASSTSSISSAGSTSSSIASSVPSTLWHTGLGDLDDIQEGEGGLHESQANARVSTGSIALQSSPAGARSLRETLSRSLTNTVSDVADQISKKLSLNSGRNLLKNGETGVSGSSLKSLRGSRKQRGPIEVDVDADVDMMKDRVMTRMAVGRKKGINIKENWLGIPEQEQLPGVVAGRASKPHGPKNPDGTVRMFKNVIADPSKASTKEGKALAQEVADLTNLFVDFYNKYAKEFNGELDMKSYLNGNPTNPKSKEVLDQLFEICLPALYNMASSTVTKLLGRILGYPLNTNFYGSSHSHGKDIKAAKTTDEKLMNAARLNYHRVFVIIYVALNVQNKDPEIIGKGITFDGYGKMIGVDGFPVVSAGSNRKAVIANISPAVIPGGNSAAKNQGVQCAVAANVGSTSAERLSEKREHVSGQTQGLAMHGPPSVAKLAEHMNVEKADKIRLASRETSPTRFSEKSQNDSLVTNGDGSSTPSKAFSRRKTDDISSRNGSPGASPSLGGPSTSPPKLAASSQGASASPAPELEFPAEWDEDIDETDLETPEFSTLTVPDALKMYFQFPLPIPAPVLSIAGNGPLSERIPEGITRKNANPLLYAVARAFSLVYFNWQNDKEKVFGKEKVVTEAGLEILNKVVRESFGKGYLVGS